MTDRSRLPAPPLVAADATAESRALSAVLAIGAYLLVGALYARRRERPAEYEMAGRLMEFCWERAKDLEA